jgi:hypothetical protein
VTGQQIWITNAIWEVARSVQEFTADDVQTVLGFPTGIDALGPALQRAARLGWIESSEVAVRSHRPGARGKFVVIWVSRVYHPERSDVVSQGGQ